MSSNKIEILVVKGVEGPSLYINNYRVAGNKPWGGGDTWHSWKVDLEDILTPLNKNELRKWLETQ